MVRVRREQLHVAEDPGSRRSPDNDCGDGWTLSRRDLGSRQHHRVRDRLVDTGLQRVSVDGGPVTVLTRPDPGRGERDHVQPGWLPDHRKLLFTITPQRGGVDGSKIAVLDLESGTWRTVLEGGFGARYVEGGYLVYAAAGALWATRFDLTRQETRGPRVEILKPVSTNLPGATAEFDVAGNGTLAYTRGASSDVEFVPVWVDRSGRETPIPAPPDKYRHPRFSPDGKRVAIAKDDITSGI